MTVHSDKVDPGRQAAAPSPRPARRRMAAGSPMDAANCMRSAAGIARCSWWETMLVAILVASLHCQRDRFALFPRHMESLRRHLQLHREGARRTAAGAPDHRQGDRHLGRRHHGLASVTMGLAAQAGYGSATLVATGLRQDSPADALNGALVVLVPRTVDRRDDRNDVASSAARPMRSSATRS